MSRHGASTPNVAGWPQCYDRLSRRQLIVRFRTAAPIQLIGRDFGKRPTTTLHHSVHKYAAATARRFLRSLLWRGDWWLHDHSRDPAAAPPPHRRRPFEIYRRNTSAISIGRGWQTREETTHPLHSDAGNSGCSVLMYKVGCLYVC